MDVASLLYGYRPTSSQDEERKSNALEQTFAHLRLQDAALTLDSFIEALPSQLLTHVFGSAAEDSFITGMMAGVSRHIPNLDVFAAAVMNAVVVEMNFQTRLAIDGVFGPPEALVFAGDRALFPIAMAQGNETLGILESEQGQMFAVPGWLEQLVPEMSLKSDNLMECRRGDIAHTLTGLGRTRVGVVIIAPESGGAASAELYNGLAEIGDLVTKHTIYCIADTAETIISAARSFQEINPAAEVKIRLYSVRCAGGLEYRGVLVASGFTQWPSVSIKNEISRPCRFVQAIDKSGVMVPGVEVLDYPRSDGDLLEGLVGPHPQKPRGRWEPLHLKSPLAIASSAPLPPDARRRISDSFHLYHSTIGAEGGMIFPSFDAMSNVYLHATRNADVILDYGDEERHIKTSLPYLASVEQDDGTRVGTLSASRLVRIAGAAIPLAFSPIVTKWHSHFLIQCLPRVRMAQDLGFEATMLVPEGLRPKQMEMLEILGFPANRVVVIAPDTIVQADYLIVPNALNLAFSAYTTEIYRRLVAHFRCDPAAPGRRLLISRASRTSWRNMLNYEPIKAMLIERYGFEIVAAENLTLEEEVRLYNSAEIVVGAEGAGMYGSVFARPNSVYISMCDEDYVMPITASLASIIGFEIAYVFGESRRAASDLRRRLPFGHADFIIDPIRLIEVIETAIQKVSSNQEQSRL